MERREIEEMQRFFSTAGHRTPLAYFGLPETAQDGEIEAAIKKRRSWAQGQQANPKYRSEALFIIKFNGHLRKLLLEERELYEETFVKGQASERVDELDGFIRGALVGGALTPQVQGAIQVHGRQLELDDAVVRDRIEALANELGVTRQTDQDVGASASSIDFYELLQITPFANDQEIEVAYRAKYRWARNLKDLERSSQILAALDDAWRILRDTERRARYDLQRSAAAEVTEEVDRRADHLQKLLHGASGPQGGPPPSQPQAQTSESMLAEVRAKTSMPPLPTSSGGFEVTRLVRPESNTDAASPAPVPVMPPPFQLEGRGDAPVPNIAGRTIGLGQGPQQLRERAPRLILPGPPIVRLTVPRNQPANHLLKIQNGGPSRMPGKIQTDVDWLAPERPWLDPMAKDQTVTIEVRPEAMPANFAVGTITIVTDHGERKVVSFEVKRRTFARPLFLLLLLMVSIALTKHQIDQQLAEVPVAVPVLSLSVDPPADSIMVDDLPLTSGKSASIEAPVTGRPFRLSVRAEGFADHDEIVNLSGGSVQRQVRLELTDQMVWQPLPGTPATLLGGEAAKRVRAQAPAIGACYTDGAKRGVTLSLSMRATADGHIRALEVEGSGVNLDQGRECVNRIVRATRLEPFAGVWAPLNLPLELVVGR